MENYAEKSFSYLINNAHLDKDSAIKYLTHFADELKSSTVDLQLEKQDLERRINCLSNMIKDNVSHINDLEIFIKKFNLNNNEE